VALFLSGVLCFFLGLAVVSLCRPRRHPPFADLLLQVCLAAGFGLGIFSIIFFLCRVFDSERELSADLGALIIFSVVALLRLRKIAVKPADTSEREDEHQPTRFQHFVTTAFVAALVAALYAAVLRMRTFPHGEGWDAFAFWNLHARFLFLGSAHWRDGFTALLPGSHPDYPLLLPAAIAHFWTYVGWDDPRVPAIIGFVFTFATVGILFASLSILRGKTSAMLAATTLLATPFFLEQGTAQYADVPLAFFYLAAIALICLHDNETDSSTMSSAGFLSQAGLAAGFAAWTKNEGVLFVCALVASRTLIAFRSRRQAAPDFGLLSACRISLAYLLAGILPILLVVMYFKRAIAPSSELFADRAMLFHKLLDPGRYWAIIRWYAKDFLRFGHWLLIPGTLLLVGFGIVARRNDEQNQQAGFRTGLLALSLTLAGYFAIYVITPYDLYWHLRFSLDRLFLQAWPSAVFLFFVAIKNLPVEPVKTF
jgi:Dolichyl-phosphate-mannose-protein mannosyltransferase